MTGLILVIFSGLQAACCSNLLCCGRSDKPARKNSLKTILDFAVAITIFAAAFEKAHLERCPSGLRSTPGKCVYAKSVSGVRIPVSPLHPPKRTAPRRVVSHLHPPTPCGLRRVKERWQSWFNVPDSKSGVPSRVPGVRIPLSPLKFIAHLSDICPADALLFYCFGKLFSFTVYRIYLNFRGFNHCCSRFLNANSRRGSPLARRSSHSFRSFSGN